MADFLQKDLYDLWRSLNLNKENYFCSYDNLLKFQKETNEQISNIIHRDKSITSNERHFYDSEISEIFNSWEPLLTWTITPFFRSQDLSQEIQNLSQTITPTFSIQLMTTIDLIVIQVKNVKNTIDEVLSSRLIKCNDIEIARNICNVIYDSSSDKIKERINNFVIDHFDIDMSCMIAKGLAMSPDPDCELKYVPSKDCLNKLGNLLHEEQRFSERSHILEYKRNKIKNIKNIIKEDCKGIDSKEKELISISLQIWNPMVFWNHDISLWGVKTEVINMREVLITNLVYKIRPASSCPDILKQIKNVVNSFRSLNHNHYSVNGERQFLRDIYSQIYIFLDKEQKKKLEEILCSNCNICFLDYSDEYIEDEYFEIIPANDSINAGTKHRAMISGVNGECLGKGLFKKL